MDWTIIRRKLSELGFLPDLNSDSAIRNFQRNNGLTADGDVGPATTKVAVKAFQKAKGLALVDGIVGPKTLAALQIEKSAVPAKPGLTIPSVPWMDIALEKLGLNEITNKKTLSDFLKSDGKTLGDPSKLPWCGDFVETCIRLAIPGVKVPANPYWALNWKDWGESVEPQYGAILAFERNGGGHVGFYVGENSTSYLVLGGNQSNSVSKAPVKKSQMRGSRMPPGYVSKNGVIRFQVDESEKPLDSDQMQ